MIYFDNAATTQMSEAAISALMEVSTNCYGNPSSIYKAGKDAKKILDASRKIIADCISAQPEEIYFTSGGTESNNWVINELSNGFSKVITSTIEHHAILFPCEKIQASGRNVSYVSVDSNGLVKESELLNLLEGTPSLVSIMFQNNETGITQNIKKLSDLVHKDNSCSLFHTDAVQAVGHTKINVKELGIDLLSASAHKFNGPKGIGFLYIRKGIKISPFILGGGQEHGMRSGTENVASIYSMAKALEDNTNIIKSVHEHIDDLENYFFLLMDNGNVQYTINPGKQNKAAGIINISIKNAEGEGLLNILDMKNICVSVGSACNSESKQRSHVLKAMCIDNELIDSAIRISIGRYNTKEEIEALAKEIINYSRLV